MPRTDSQVEPSIDYIRELANWNATHWAPQRAIDEQIRNQILNEHTVAVPDTLHPERRNRQEPERMSSGIGPHALRLISSLYTTPARLGVRFSGPGAKGQTIVDRAEIALNEAFAQLNPPTDAPRSREIKHMVGLGRLCRLILPGHVAWWDAPRFQEEGYGSETNAEYMRRMQEWRRKAPLPILWQDLPPESTFPPSHGRVDDEMLSTVLTSWWEILESFTEEEVGDVLPEREKRHEQVMLAIYANDTWVAWAVLPHEAARVRIGPLSFGARQSGAKVLRSIEHGMGRCPIRLLPGVTGAWKEPGLYWRSVLFDVREMIPQVDARFSEAATGSKFSNLPWLKYWRNRREEMTPSDAQAHMQKMLSGDIVDLDAGGDGVEREDIQPLFLPPYGEKTLLLAQFQLELIRRMTGATDAIEGLSVAGVETAWERNFTAELAKGFFKELTDKVVAADIDAAEQIIRAVVAFDEEVVLARQSGEGYISLRPGEVRDFEPVLKGEYGLRIPQNRRADIEQGISLMERVRQNDLPIDLFWIEEQFLGIEQPTEMYKDALKTRFILSPELQQWHLKQLLRDADVAVGEDEGMSLQEFEDELAREHPEVQRRLGPYAAMVRDRVARRRAPPTAARRELQGAVAAATPFRQQRGGPQPVEEV